MEHHLPYGITQRYHQTEVNVPCLVNNYTGRYDLPTYTRGIAELTGMLVIYLDGLPVHWQLPIIILINYQYFEKDESDTVASATSDLTGNSNPHFDVKFRVRHPTLCQAAHLVQCKHTTVTGWQVGSFYARKQNASRVFAIVWASVCHTRELYQNGAS